MNTITDDWIEANFDINKERRKVVKKSDTFDCKYELEIGHATVSNFFNSIQKTVIRMRTESTWGKIPTNAVPYINISSSYPWDTTSFEISIYFKWTELETNEQVIKRLKKTRKIKISDETNKSTK